MAPVISCIHATRGRAELPWKARNEWWAYKADPSGPSFEWIMAMDDDDPLAEVFSKRAQAGTDPGPGTTVLVNPSNGNNDAWAKAYQASTGRVIVQVSDDFEAPHGWNTTIVERLEKAGGIDKPFCLGVADPHFTPPYSGDGLLTLIIVTRAYVQKTGFDSVLYPEYPSMFSDNDVREKVALDDMLIDAWDVMFLHHWHGGPEDPLRDDTYSRHASTRCNDIGRWVWADRSWAAYPDIYPEHFDPDRPSLINGDLEEGLCPPYNPEESKRCGQRRRELGFGWIKNKPFEPSDPRAAWLRGDYREARDGMEALMAKYHLKVCNGRFLMYGAHRIWEECSKILKDRRLVDLREHHNVVGGFGAR